ncbi:MAG: helix-turn-helix domain-containing protein [Dysgonamonadaceae bacterium]|jgi:ligand-binding sensor domain-containing protein/AraC-like DNA-binding protein|nr:helix-turn-helix domain-containing protein [Dysgonamonadaceae bacterium]
MRKIIFLLFMFSGNVFPASSFGPDLHFTTINTDNGLSNNTINAIYKDSAGFIWLGTQNGFNRFDGINVEVYPDFNNETIYTICETDSNRLWVGTNFGLKVLSRKSGSIRTVELPGINPIAVRALKFHKETLYICTDHGLFTQKENSIEKTEINSTGHLTGIIIDSGDNCWLTSDDGLIYYNPHHRKHEKYLYSPTNNILNKFYCLIQVGSKIYIGSENTGVLVFDIPSKTFTRFTNLGNNCILNLNFHQNKLYVGTNGGGLKIVSLENQSVSSVTHDPNNPYSISSNAIYSFLLDDQTFWIGTFFSGLNYNIISRDIFRVYSLPGKLNTLDLNVRSFWIGNDGRKIIGTRNGFFFISEKESVFRNFSSENTRVLKSNIILSIFPWNNQFLIGTYSGGLYTFNPQTMTLSEFKDEQLFTNNSFYSFTSDKDKRIWFGTLSGVICFDPHTGKITQYTSSDSGLTDNLVYSILCDSDNRIWIGTAEGVCLYDNKTQTIRKDIFPAGFNPNLKMIRHLYQDSSGDIWICSEKNGLVQIDKSLSAGKHYTDKNLLPDIFAISTIEDNFGYLWISTAKGLIRFDKQTGNYFLFSLTDGIPALLFNHSVQKDEEGTIWWANEKGLLHTLPPENPKTDPGKKPIVVTAVYIGGKRIKPGTPSLQYAPEFTSIIHLESNQDNVDIRFSGLDFGILKSEIYEYKLDGQDSTWNRLIGQNQISYTDVKPGRYKLHIRKAGSLEPEKNILILKKKSYATYFWIGISILIILTEIYFYRIQLIKLSNLKKKIVDPVKKRMDHSEKYQNSKLVEEESILIRNALLEYMEREQPYLNSKLKLADASAAIKYPQAKISQVLNQNLKTNFTDFVNKYRVTEFKKKAQTDSIHQYTLTALSEKCGFNSRSSFFHVFKKITGQTPLEFLKESGIQSN